MKCFERLVKDHITSTLHSLFTHDCVAMHASNSIIKFADDTTAYPARVVGNLDD